MLRSSTLLSFSLKMHSSKSSMEYQSRGENERHTIQFRRSTQHHSHGTAETSVEERFKHQNLGCFSVTVLQFESAMPRCGF